MKIGRTYLARLARARGMVYTPHRGWGLAAAGASIALKRGRSSSDKAGAFQPHLECGVGVKPDLPEARVTWSRARAERLKATSGG